MNSVKNDIKIGKELANELYKLETFVARCENFTAYSSSALAIMSTMVTGAMAINVIPSDFSQSTLIGLTIALGGFSVYTTADCIFSKRIKLNRDHIRKLKIERDNKILSLEEESGITKVIKYRR